MIIFLGDIRRKGGGKLIQAMAKHPESNLDAPDILRYVFLSLAVVFIDLR